MSNIIDKIQVSGVTYDISGGNPTVELTQAEYDALVTAGTVSADTYYIITDAVQIDVSAVTSSVTSASTNSQIPTAKAVYDALGEGGITSGEVQTMIDASISGKANSSDVYLKSETSGATEIQTALNAKLDTTTFNSYSASVQSIISDWVQAMIGVEYIQSTDGYQYINLGYVPSGSGVEIGGEIMIVSYPSTAQWMTTAYIAYTGEQYEAFRMIRRSNEDGTLYCNHHTKASGQGQAMSMTLGNKYTFKFTDSEYQFGADTYTNTGGTGTTNTATIKLFGNGSAIGAITRIYSFYIKKNDEYVMNLIPVVKNGIGMMYDKVSGQFFANNGTGSFTFPSS